MLRTYQTTDESPFCHETIPTASWEREAFTISVATSRRWFWQSLSWESIQFTRFRNACHHLPDFLFRSRHEVNQWGLVKAHLRSARQGNPKIVDFLSYALDLVIKVSGKSSTTVCGYCRCRPKVAGGVGMLSIIIHKDLRQDMDGTSMFIIRYTGCSLVLSLQYWALVVILSNKAASIILNRINDWNIYDKNKNKSKYIFKYIHARGPPPPL